MDLGFKTVSLHFHPVLEHFHELWKSECDNWLLVDKSSAPNFLSSCSKFLETWNLSLAFQFRHLVEPIPKKSLQDQPCAGAETACAKVLAATTRPLPNVPTSSCSEHLPHNKCSRLLMFILQEKASSNIFFIHWMLQSWGQLQASVVLHKQVPNLTSHCRGPNRR